MSDQKYTPGPWKSRIASPSDATLIVAGPAPDGDGYERICTVRAREDRDYSKDDDRALANARLIAAAPDLLEACRLTLQILENLTTEDYSRGGDKPARKALEAAVAKAESRETE